VRYGLLAAIALSLIAAVPASARPTGIAAHAVSSCSPHRVNVRFQDGSVHTVTHVLPGPRLRTVTSTTRDLYIVARIRASWSRVTGGAGHRLTLTADGPGGEQWTWQFQLHAAHPLADPTNYVVCLHPKAGGHPFVRRMKQAHGSWKFTLRLVSGRLKGSIGATSLRSR
jgi:hypothetical protein